MSLTVKGLTKRFGNRLLFADVTFGIGKGERAALIGPNGAGKTTLLKILINQEEADAGLIEKPRTGSALGYLAQDQISPSERTLFEEALQASPAILALRHEKDAVEHAMATTSDMAHIHDLTERYHQLLTQYEALEGYAYEGRVARVLKGLGFTESTWEQPVSTLSGGERNQLELGKLLVEEPPLLLLDEPTNHLDLQAVEWLEEYLQSYPGAILVVTHDRYFLDRVCTRIMELAGGRLESYTGGYERFLAQKAERIELQQRMHEKQTAEIEKLTRFINRWRADSKRATQAKSREKRRAKIEVVQVDKSTDRDLALVFRQSQPSWNEVLTVENLACRFGARTLFEDINFTVERGERLALLGRNGAGKTTLMRMLMEGVGDNAGSITWGGQTEPGYFAQTRVEFEPDATVFSAIAAAHPQLARQQVAALLGAVGFTGGEWERPVELCSGGERSRIALGILLASRSNVLLLDEPTNHLDILAREALEEALEGYPGTIIFISHDRRFIDRLADKMLLIDGAKTRMIHGNYAHWQWLQAQERTKQPVLAATEAAASRGPARTAPARKSGGGGKKAAWSLDQIIEEVDRVERAIADHHTQLADPELHKDFRQAQLVQETLGSLEAELAEWLERMDAVG